MSTNKPNLLPGARPNVKPGQVWQCRFPVIGSLYAVQIVKPVGTDRDRAWLVAWTDGQQALRYVAVQESQLLARMREKS